MFLDNGGQHSCASRIYPNLPSTAAKAENFRLVKVNEITATLTQEVDHYRLVQTRHKWAKMIISWLAGGVSGLSSNASSASFASALSIIGVLASVLWLWLAAVFALVSSGLIIVSKELEGKITKHQEIVTFALAKQDTVGCLVSKALEDNRIGDLEFQIIGSELQQ